LKARSDKEEGCEHFSQAAYIDGSGVQAAELPCGEPSSKENGPKAAGAARSTLAALRRELLALSQCPAANDSLKRNNSIITARDRGRQQRQRLLHNKSPRTTDIPPSAASPARSPARPRRRTDLLDLFEDSHLARGLLRERARRRAEGRRGGSSTALGGTRARLQSGSRAARRERCAECAPTGGSSAELRFRCAPRKDKMRPERVRSVWLRDSRRISASVSSPLQSRGGFFKYFAIHYKNNV
jgi:hypothetical protein